MKPLLCVGEDGAHYVLKPFSAGGSWPLILEWICARLGRAVGLPIPNYRKIIINEDLADAWNAFNPRRIEAGIGFGSQLVAGALEYDEGHAVHLPPELPLKLLAFDWWVRNPDRVKRNPNLLWSADSRAIHVIDHDQAAQTGSADNFWSLHLFRDRAAPSAPWLPAEFKAKIEPCLGLLPEIMAELPSAWTSSPEGLTWLARQLEHTIKDQPHTDWRNYD